MGGFPDLSKLPVAQREKSEIFTTHLGLLYIIYYLPKLSVKFLIGTNITTI